MAFYDSAAGNSIFNGYYYNENGDVKECRQISDYEYDGKVKGSNSNVYDVHIDVQHPKKSTCTCPRANGKRVLCKHICALYFHAYPDEAKKYYDELVYYREEEEKEDDLVDIEIKKYFSKMSKEELVSEVMSLVYGLPDWEFEQFVRMNIKDDYRRW